MQFYKPECCLLLGWYGKDFSVCHYFTVQGRMLYGRFIAVVHTQGKSLPYCWQWCYPKTIWYPRVQHIMPLSQGTQYAELFFLNSLNHESHKLVSFPLQPFPYWLNNSQLDGLSEYLNLDDFRLMIGASNYFSTSKNSISLLKEVNKSIRFSSHCLLGMHRVKKNQQDISIYFQNKWSHSGNQHSFR